MCKPNSRDSFRGFSLLEMMAVISLILILATFATPLYHTIQVRVREATLKQKLFTLRSQIGFSPPCDFGACGNSYTDQQIKQIFGAVAQQTKPLENPCFWGSWTKSAAEVGVGGGILAKVTKSAITGEAVTVYGGQKIIAGIGAYENGKQWLGPFYNGIMQPVNQWVDKQVNKACTALGNLMAR